MSTHDVVEVSPGPPADRRRRRLAAVGLVLVLLAAGGGTAAWAVTRGGSAAGAGGDAVSCPVGVAEDAQPGGTVEVPSPPTASGVDGRLVPARPPAALTVCEYSLPLRIGAVANGPEYATSIPAVPPASLAPTDPTAAAFALSRSRTFAGGDAPATALSAALQRATVTSAAAISCAYTERSWAQQYLVGLAYDDGVVWVATPDVCVGATNGVSHSDVELGPDIATALDDAPDTPVSPPATPPATASAVTPPSGSTSPEPGTATTAPGGTVDPRTPGDPGTGADPGTPPATDAPADPFLPCSTDNGPVPDSTDELVPFTPTSVVVCHEPVGAPDAPAAPTSSVQPAAVAVELADALDALLVLDSNGTCPALGGESWQLLFRADGGTQIAVLVDSGGCRTATTGTRTSQLDTSFLARLVALG